MKLTRAQFLKALPAAALVLAGCTAAPTAPAVLPTIGRSVYAVSGTASIVSALSQWRRTLAEAVMDESDRTRVAALQTVLDGTPLGRIAP